ncbi:MAG: sulfite exporter TauE/SafE family protein [Frankiaceae bacterium]
MDVDLYIALAGLIVGFVVGLTGMGGGALMTPVLVLLFGVQPLAAVSSDLVAAFVMKPVGGAVHARRGTVHKGLVLWLCVGSVPAAFCGVFVLRAVGGGPDVQDAVKLALGVALLLAAATMVVKTFMQMRRNVRDRAAGITRDSGGPIVVKPLPTVLIGAIGGLVVGMTSVGSGSLIIVMLLLLYPLLRANDLVGTDLVQAVPLVGSAALAHVLFGDFQFGLTSSLLIGAIPGVYLGARWSAVAPGWLIRRALVIVLTASALRLLGVSTAALGWLLLAGIVVAPLVWRSLRPNTKARAHAAARTQPPETARPGDPAGMRVLAPDPAA